MYWWDDKSWCATAPGTFTQSVLLDHNTPSLVLDGGSDNLMLNDGWSANPSLSEFNQTTKSGQKLNCAWLRPHAGSGRVRCQQADPLRTRCKDAVNSPSVEDSLSKSFLKSSRLRHWCYGMD